MRFFNTSGPIVADDHYHVPPLSRLDAARAARLDRAKTVLRAACASPDGQDHGVACAARRVEWERAVSVRIGERRGGPDRARGCAPGSGRHRGLPGLGGGVRGRRQFPIRLAGGRPERAPPDRVLRRVLARWAVQVAKPLVLLIDEIDALVGDTLVSLRLGGFREPEVRDLLKQHTDDTGQRFDERAVTEIWRLTRGQPWLVNALAWEVCFESAGVRDRGRQVNVEAVQDARERCGRNHSSGASADGGLHGRVGRGRGPPRSLRPDRVQVAGGKGLPAQGRPGRPYHYRVGNVGETFS